jgi:hypothetical protein
MDLAVQGGYGPERFHGSTGQGGFRKGCLRSPMIFKRIGEAKWLMVYNIYSIGYTISPLWNQAILYILHH